MRLYNTLSKNIEEIDLSNGLSIYSCGPTVYDSVHIGNLFAFIAADTLRRAVMASGSEVKHVMNVTDIDDKTILRAQQDHPDDEPMKALGKVTSKYESVFLEDIKAVGVDTDVIEFVRATEHIDQMKDMVTELVDEDYAYIADDGIYFSIEKYTNAGRKYGQLVEITASSTGAARVDNDEYDKDNVHDFALWKTAKEGEPSWPFEIDGKNMSGRPGWHIECSAMSKEALGEVFDVHTGGVDLKFPHHENEIAQSTAISGGKFANIFIHNEHVMVDGRKMSKSLNNFYTLGDIKKKDFNPLAFRMLANQSHYRTRANFSWVNLQSAQTRLHNLYRFAELRWQASDSESAIKVIDVATQEIIDAINDDLNTPKALEIISKTMNQFVDGVHEADLESFKTFLETIDSALGLSVISNTPDIDDEIKNLLKDRADARKEKDFEKSDEIRDTLSEKGIEVLDRSDYQIWHRTY